MMFSYSCVLVTFYFTQEILPSLASSGKSFEANGVAESVGMEDAVEFVHLYGSYLWLHLSLVYAATVRADAVIENLLALSKHDPRHREVMKELSKASSLILYEPVRHFALGASSACIEWLLLTYNLAARFSTRRCCQQFLCVFMAFEKSPNATVDVT
jgi:hypothetical protein